MAQSMLVLICCMLFCSSIHLSSQKDLKFMKENDYMQLLNKKLSMLGFDYWKEKLQYGRSSLQGTIENTMDLYNYLGNQLKRGQNQLQGNVENIMNLYNHLGKQFEIEQKSLQENSMENLYQYSVDPDVNRNMTQLVLSQGYRSEQYTVQTADGFLLNLQRIPAGRNEHLSGTKSSSPKPVVFLQHGLLSSSCDWVMNFANGSLGFILADAGYDVWLGNSRGNTYSRRHVSLKPSDNKFWDWSFDEMAKYDLPAFIDFVLAKSNQSALYYIGHSQGTTMAFALLSQKPEYQKKIKLFVAMAPVTTITHSESPITYLAGIPDAILFDIFGKQDFLPSNALLKLWVDLTCKHKETRWLCSNLLFLLCGPDISNLNSSRLQVYMSHTPAGASTKDLAHFAQVYREKKFLMYNYDSASENMKHYNQPTPPEYNVTKINVPILALTGSKDWLADPQDASALMASLPNVKQRINFETWNHIDFVWGKDAAHVCYYPVVQWMKKFREI